MSQNSTTMEFGNWYHENIITIIMYILQNKVYTFKNIYLSYTAISYIKLYICQS